MAAHRTDGRRPARHRGGDRLLLVLAGVLPCSPRAARAGRRRSPRTLRVDYVHTGTATEERFALDGAGARGPLARPARPRARRHGPRPVPLRGEGRRQRPRCSTRAASPASTASGRRPPEAKDDARAASTSRVRFPEPAAPVKVVHRRSAAPTSAFREVWSVAVDPADPGDRPRGAAGRGRVWAVQRRAASRATRWTCC